jgi:NitT/TauT family transport system substrate-binding protein
VSIREKHRALEEVIYYIHKAGLDIEVARREGGQAMVAISNMIRKHIPEHNEAAIVQSLRPDLNVINYRHLNLDPEGLRLIMDLAVEGGILSQPIDIEEFADRSFSTEITEQ